MLAVELFVSDGRLLVNELAPRPHNSGHWTLDAAVDEPVRAAGAGGVRRWRSGRPTLTAPAVAMVNLLGDRWADGEPDWAAALADPAARLHLYGKRERPPRPQDGPPHGARPTPDAAAGAVVGPARASHADADELPIA